MDEKEMLIKGLENLGIKANRLLSSLNCAAERGLDRPEWFRHIRREALNYNPSPVSSELTFSIDRFNLDFGVYGSIAYSRNTFAPEIREQRIVIQLADGSIIGENFSLVWVLNKGDGLPEVYDEGVLTSAKYLKSIGRSEWDVTAVAFWQFRQPAWVRGQSRPEDYTNTITIHCHKKIDWVRLRRLTEEQLRKQASPMQQLVVAQYLGANLSRV